MKTLLLTLLLASAALSHAAPAPTLIPFQGRLTDQAGNVYTNGSYTLIFNLYDVAVGGTPLWTETHQKVGVINGMVNVFLGSINGNLVTNDFSQTRHLGITIDPDNNPTTLDPEMVPRQMIIPAFWAQNTSKLAGYDWSSLLTSGNNPSTGFLRGDKIAAGSLLLSSLSPAARASLGSTLVQNASVPGLTALEAISSRDALAVIKSAGLPRIGRAAATTSDRAAFFGFALAAAAIGQDVAAQQYGPLDGFTGLRPGSNYYLNTNLGGITTNFPAGYPVYIGHALSATVLFVDPFGASQTWGAQNFWGTGADGAFSSTGTNLFATDKVDGDVVVKQFSSLTINANDFVSTQTRCRGLVIYVNGNATINGTLSMTARGAKADPTLANSISATGIRIIRRKTGGTDILQTSDLGGTGLGGVGTAWKAVEALQPPIVGNGAIYTIAREGGAGGVGPTSYAVDIGKAIANGTGGGTSGYGNNSGGKGGNGAAGTCYSGGSGGGGSQNTSSGQNGVSNGGAGGEGAAGGGVGAGNPGGNGADDGTGGLLVLFVRGNLTVGAQGKISSNGSFAGQGSGSPGGGSGGGRVIVLYGTALSKLGAITAGGANDSGTNPPGGNGEVTTAKIDP